MGFLWVCSTGRNPTSVYARKTSTSASYSQSCVHVWNSSSAIGWKYGFPSNGSAPATIAIPHLEVKDASISVWGEGNSSSKTPLPWNSCRNHGSVSGTHAAQLKCMVMKWKWDLGREAGRQRLCVFTQHTRNIERPVQVQMLLWIGKILVPCPQSWIFAWRLPRRGCCLNDAWLIELSFCFENNQTDCRIVVGYLMFVVRYPKFLPLNFAQMNVLPSALTAMQQQPMRNHQKPLSHRQTISNSVFFAMMICATLVLFVYSGRVLIPWASVGATVSQ